MVTSKEFIAKFLMWYDDMGSLPDRVNEHRLDQLAGWAKELQSEFLKEEVDRISIGESIERVIKKYKIKPKKKKISRYL